MLRYESLWFDSRFRLLSVRVFLWVNRKTQLAISTIFQILIGSVRYRPGRASYVPCRKYTGYKKSLRRNDF
jgi:hypothetical protein